MPDTATLLITPHQFPDLEREKRLADEFGLELVVAGDQQELTAAMPHARIVMVTPYGRVGAAEFAAMEGCIGVVRYGIGYDNIDVSAAKEAGVPVSIVPDASTEEVASHAFALGLALTRRIPAGQAAISAGKWAGAVPADLPVLSKLQVGVVGMGRIGRHVARWWSAVGADVKAYDPIAQFDDVASAPVDEIIQSSDVITLHVPLNDETHHMISRDSIARMRRGAVVVNVSRGGLIDEKALADALRDGHLGGAGLDVFESEPLAADNPLRDAPNTFLTPHSAWKSRSSLSALQDGAVRRSRNLLGGEEPPDRVA
ncbi:C-terminal binding protein [Streptomyces carpinensis]|uniref:C-terminal binding protein n=1 Tax=Streptomyces carpinensis TaxID=66369 RepID=A0ABV1W1Q1_9ACTN|nr:C-terminal binding protein [Streptomyces carpinensis]